MVRKRLFVYSTKRDQNNHIYESGSFYRSFLITTIKSEEFKTFLKGITFSKPLYGLLVKKSSIQTEDIPEVCKTFDPDDDIVLIPTGLNSSPLPIVQDGNVKEVNRVIRKGIHISKALLFCEDYPEGYIDRAIITDIQSIIKNKVLKIDRNKIMNGVEIADHIWKLRNDKTFNIMSESLSKKVLKLI